MSTVAEVHARLCAISGLEDECQPIMDLVDAVELEVNCEFERAEEAEQKLAAVRDLLPGDWGEKDIVADVGEVVRKWVDAEAALATEREHANEWLAQAHDNAKVLTAERSSHAAMRAELARQRDLRIRALYEHRGTLLTLEGDKLDAGRLRRLLAGVDESINRAEKEERVAAPPHEPHYEGLAIAKEIATEKTRSVIAAIERVRARQATSPEPATCPMCRGNVTNGCVGCGGGGSLVDFEEQTGAASK